MTLFGWGEYQDYFDLFVETQADDTCLDRHSFVILSDLESLSIPI